MRSYSLDFISLVSRCSHGKSCGKEKSSFLNRSFLSFYYTKYEENISICTLPALIITVL